MGTKRIDDFYFALIEFMADLHDYHICGYLENQVKIKTGKQRTFCTKYGRPIKMVRWECIDRYHGFTFGEIEEIKSQHRAGKAILVINGVRI